MIVWISFKDSLSSASPDKLPTLVRDGAELIRNCKPAIWELFLAELFEASSYYYKDLQGLMPYGMMEQI